MNIPLYIAITALFIGCYYFMFNSSPKSTGGDFGLFSLIFTWILGGAFGFMMHSIETAVFMSLIMSLIFI